MKTGPLYRSIIAVVALTASLFAAPACAAPRGRVYVRLRPPAPIVEARVVSPGPGFVWVSGYHNWNGRAYVWVPGRWERPPRPRAVWVPAHWQHERHGWYLEPGRWR